MNVLVIGPYGRVGTAIIDHLEDRDEYEFTYLDIEDRPEYETVVADMTDYEAVRPAFDSQDAVIHLAYTFDEYTDAHSRTIHWADEVRDNLIATTNVVEAAIDAGVGKCLYASSHHVVGLHEVLNRPEIYSLDFDLEVDRTDIVCPDSMYGVTKVYSEGVGHLAARMHNLSFYALRIGAIRHAERDHPYGEAENRVEAGEIERWSDEYDELVARYKGLWQSRRDFAQMVDLCLQDDTVEFDIFYGVSDNDRRWLDISHSREVLGYDPQDNGEEWTAPPG